MSENINHPINLQELADAGVHFGHLKSKWDPRMAPYIFTEKNGIHLIDLNKTARKMEEAGAAVKSIASTGRKVLFVATKKQAKEIVKEAANKVGMPFVTDRWLGGMLTNFPTVLKSIKRMGIIDKMLADGTVDTLAKKERLMLSREREKLERVLGGISKEKKIPAAIFVVDMKKEHIAIAEATKLNLTSFAIADTNANPNQVDFAIPGNDDAAKSIQLITDYMVKCIQDGLNEYRMKRDNIKEEIKNQGTAQTGQPVVGQAEVDAMKAQSAVAEVEPVETIVAEGVTEVHHHIVEETKEEIASEQSTAAEASIDPTAEHQEEN
jgi:small subunit ribosomal protein S2